MTGRSVPEWVAKHPDQAVPRAVRVRVFERAGGVCHISGRKIRTGEAWELEHVKPLSMGGEHRETNLAPALAEDHRIKTAAEAGPRAKADRIRAKNLGVWPKPTRTIQSRGFQPGRNAGFEKGKA